MNAPYTNPANTGKNPRDSFQGVFSLNEMFWIDEQIFYNKQTWL